MVRKYLVLCWGFSFLHFVFLPFKYIHLHFLLRGCLFSICLVTQSQVLRSWRPDWVTPGGRAACPKSVSTLAWVRWVVPPPNSVCWTALSTIAVPPSTPCALTSIHWTAWCSVSPTKLRCLSRSRCVKRSSAEYIRPTWASNDFYILK